jgi:hypothetical protein
VQAPKTQALFQAFIMGETVVTQLQHAQTERINDEFHLPITANIRSRTGLVIGKGYFATPLCFNL